MVICWGVYEQILIREHDNSLNVTSHIKSNVMKRP